MAEPVRRRRAGPRRWRRRTALPRSRRALALGGLMTVVVLGLLLLGVSRARPGTEVPAYETATTTTGARGPVPAPVMTTVPTVPAPPGTAARTTRRR